MSEKKYTFIDLFAGLGGFHLALQQLGCECVFASELKEDLRRLYKINFPGTHIEGDITKIDPKDIPAHDILCAGFPCQPFSQAGMQKGFGDEGRGNLFYNICDILKEHNPKYVLLENVSNLRGHDEGKTWSTIQQELEKLDYSVVDEILSPHQFKIPQHRKRIYIVCVKREQGNIEDFEFPSPCKSNCDITKIIDSSDTNITKIKADTRHQLDIWQEFINLTIKHGEKIPRFPIWAMEFGANYDFEELAPAFQSVEQLKGKKGKLGKTIVGNTVKECLSQLPIYAQTDKKAKVAKSKEVFPSWKIRYIQENRAFYEKNKSWLKGWIKKIEKFDNSHMKLEWNCGDNATPSIDDKIVQFRASGIRVKLPTFSPALNLVGTQIPIFPWVELPEEILEDGEPSKGRYMTITEAAKLQGMQNLKFGDDAFRLSTTRIFEALGNAVNVTIVKHIAKNLLKI